MERLPAIVTTDRVAFIVADVGIRGKEDAECVAWSVRLTLGTEGTGMEGGLPGEADIFTVRGVYRNSGTTLT